MRFSLPLAAAAAALALAAPAGAGTTTVLGCTFDAEPVDEVIGTGGAAFGQPIDLSGMAATVRATPFATPSLELLDDQGNVGSNVRFAFLDDVEITSGVLDVRMRLQFHMLEFYSVRLREAGSSAVSFLDILFTNSGSIRCSDLDTPSNPIVGSYTAGTPANLRITVDLDAGTYDLSYDSVLLLDDESLGSSPRGIGTLLIGVSNDAGDEGSYAVDDILVTATEVPNPVEPATWAGLKAAWR